MLRVSSQLVRGAILLTVHLGTSKDRPASANGGVVVQTLPVRISAQAEARFRRWFRCPRGTSRASTSSFFQTRPHLWHRASDHRSLTRTHSRRALGVWKRGQKSSNLGTVHGPPRDSVRDRAVSILADCDSSGPSGSPQKVIGAQDP